MTTLPDDALLDYSVLMGLLMLITVAAGVLSFKKLGRDEDAPFTVRTMIVAAAWPGATVEETTSQVTEAVCARIAAR